MTITNDCDLAIQRTEAKANIASFGVKNNKLWHIRMLGDATGVATVGEQSLKQKESLGHVNSPPFLWILARKSLSRNPAELLCILA
jgi:hypothetical protein